MIELTRAIEVGRPADQVFAFIDAEGEAPRWLGQCVELVRTSPGAKTVGSTLRYRYRQPGRQGTMEGVVTEYEPGRRLGMRYVDRMFEVSVGFDVTPTAGGAQVIERLAIEPKGLMAKLMAPLVRRATRTQSEHDMAELKRLLESAS